jgi:hypothetical protein
VAVGQLDDVDGPVLAAEAAGTDGSAGGIPQDGVSVKLLYSVWFSFLIMYLTSMKSLTPITHA